MAAIHTNQRKVEIHLIIINGITIHDKITTFSAVQDLGTFVNFSLPIEMYKMHVT